MAKKQLIKDESVQRMTLGTYADGSTRSILDAMDDEVMSPKDKKKAITKSDSYKNGKRKKAKLHL